MRGDPRPECAAIRSGGAKKNLTDRLLMVGSVVLAALMLATDRWFTAVDDECAILNRATKPVAETLRLYARGVGQHEHPPLYDLLLHAWLRLSSADLYQLRLPSILFYAFAAFVLAKAGERLGRKASQVAVFCLVAVWPFGFHFGRLACWYSFSFMVVSLLTFAYLEYFGRRTLKSWLLVFACALVLVYTNYFGWAILACLGLDFVIRNREARAQAVRATMVMAVLLLVAHLPLLKAFLREVHHGVKTGQSLLSMLLVGVYNLYCLVVSESVAPWFWYLGVPAGTAIAVGLILVLFCGPPLATRFLMYFTALLTIMTILGIAETRRTLLIGPWLMLPTGVTIGTVQAKSVRRTLVASFVFAMAIGWFGVFSRRLYAAPHRTEPWPTIGAEAATTLRAGALCWETAHLSFST